MPDLVAYYRVSTKKQGRSGLGLDAQRTTVFAFAASTGQSIVAEFTEQESGKLTTRPELLRALSECRVRRAILIVAKLDRLARNAGFLLSLRDSGVEIMACDLPSMNRMTVGIMAVVAEEEARLISERTKAALAAAKRRGVQLGRPENLTDLARNRGARASATSRSAQADRRAGDLAPMLADLKSHGHCTLAALAGALNARRVKAPRGGAWTPMAVSRVLSRSREGRANLS